MKKVEWHWWTIGQYREEEKWLNKKAQEGQALVCAFAVRYEFESCTPGEYTYKIVFTDHMPGTEGRVAFEEFLAESGIEEVGRYHRWAYYRKKNDGTPFEMFNTTREELAHANKVKNFAAVLLAVMLVTLVMEIFAFIHQPIALSGVLIFVAVMSGFVFKVYKDCAKLVKELEQENRLFE